MISKVADLIDPVTNCWDVSLVRQTFNAEDSEIILQIPIYDRTPDSIAWHFDKKRNLLGEVSLQGSSG